MLCTLVPGDGGSFIEWRLGPEVPHGVACYVRSYQLLNNVQKTFICPKSLKSLFIYNYLVVRIHVKDDRYVQRDCCGKVNYKSMHGWNLCILNVICRLLIFVKSLKIMDFLSAL